MADYHLVGTSRIVRRINQRRNEVKQKTQADSSAPIGCSPADGPLVPHNAARSPVAKSKHRYMSRAQYKAFDEVGQLPAEWVSAGWHFCLELDGALVNVEDVADFCRCFEKHEQPKVADDR